MLGFIKPLAIYMYRDLMVKQQKRINLKHLKICLCTLGVSAMRLDLLEYDSKETYSSQSR